MSGTPRLECPTKYEDLVGIFGADAKDWPGLPLFLSQICKNFKSSSDIKFNAAAKLRPVFNDEFYNGSETFTAFVTAFANAIAGREAQSVSVSPLPDFVQALINRITVSGAPKVEFKPANQIVSALGLTPTPGFIITDKIEFKWGRTLIKAIMESAVSSSTEFWNKIGEEKSAPESAFYRKVGQPGKLFTKKEGVEVEVQAGSEEFKKLMGNEGSSCFDLGIKNTAADTNACYNFVTKCLDGKGVEDCKSFMQSSDYWTEAKDSVTAMNPVLGKQLLDKFGFASEGATYQSVDDWVKGLSLPDVEKNQIANNTQLIGYLAMVVSKINSIPTKSGSVKEDPYWAAKGVPAASAKPKATPSETFERVNSLVIGIARNYGSTYLIPTIGIMSGGGVAYDIKNRVKVFEDGASPIASSSKLLSGLYKSLIAELHLINRDLDQADQDKIEELIKQVENYEKKLSIAAVYLAEYIDLNAVHGKEDTNGLVSMGHVQTFVDKHDAYYNKNQSQTEQLLSVLKRLAEAVEAEKK